MSAKPQHDRASLTEPVSDDADQLRALVSAMLSGSYQEETYLWDVSSLCQAKPEFARRLLALVERYQRLGQMPAAQYLRIRGKIEEAMPPQERRATGPASTVTMSVTAAVPVQPQSLSPEATTTAPLPTETAQPTRAPPPSPREPRAPTSAARSESAAPPPLPAPPPPEKPASALPPDKAVPTDPVAPMGQAVPTERTAPPDTPAANEPRSDAAPAERPTLKPARPAAHADLIIEPGAVLNDRYELESLLGCGGMASVYRALDRYRVSLQLPDCYVALKIIAPHSAPHADDAALGREFHNAQQLSHPNVVNVFEIGQQGGTTFYTMELLEGEKLDELLARVGGPLPRPLALCIIRDIGAAIGHAHARSVLHADLKPQNIFVTFGGHVRVLDFGGLSLHAPGPWIAEPGTTAPERYRTATPAYASCEQLEGKQVDVRDDIYALGCIAYELLTGRHPFNGLSALQARAQHLHARRPADLSATAWRALRRALAWERAQRPREIAPWLEQLGVANAAAHLPPTYELRAMLSKSGWLGWAALAASMLLCVAAGYSLSVQGPTRAYWTGLLSSARSSLRLAGTQFQQRLASAPVGAPVLAPAATPASSVPTPAATPPPRIAAADTPAHNRALQGDVAAPAGAPAPGERRSRHHPRAPSGSAAADSAATATELSSAVPTPMAPAAAPAPQSAPQPLPGASADVTVADAGTDSGAAVGSLHQTLAFSATAYQVDDTSPAARLVVRRNDGSQSELRFVWWTLDDTAKADVDYATLGRRTESIPPGQNTVTLYVPIISNPLRHETARFYVALSDPDSDSSSPSAQASVTIERGG